MNDTHLKASDLLQGAPPVTIAGLKLFGIPITEWLVLLTLIYTIVILILALRKLVTPLFHKPSEEDPPCAEDCPAMKRIRGEN